MTLITLKKQKMKKVIITESQIRNIMIEAVSNKLSQEIAKDLGYTINGDDAFIGAGDSGSVYNLNGGKVLKITYDEPLALKKAENKQIDGVVKIYKVGVVPIPAEFQTWDNEADRAYYIIMERVDTPSSLVQKLKQYNKIFVQLKNTNEMWGAVAEKYDTHNTLDFISRMVYYGKDKLINKFLEDTTKESVGISNDLIRIFNSLKKHNIYWVDVHEQQFGIDTKGNLVAFDVEDEREELMLPMQA